MRKVSLLLVLVGFATIGKHTVFAQSSVAQQVTAESSGDDLVDGILAFREKRYSEAITFFERVVATGEDKAEAHFLLARIFFESPLQDVKRAGQELDWYIT